MPNCSDCHISFEKTTKSRSSLCLPCKRIYDREWRKRRKEQGLSQRGTASKEWWDKYYQRPEVKARRAAAMRRYTKQDRVRLKMYARAAVKRALARMELSRLESCETCLHKIKTEAHHEDYSKPLDVLWVCRKCHRQIHAQAEGQK